MLRLSFFADSGKNPWGKLGSGGVLAGIDQPGTGLPDSTMCATTRIERESHPYMSAIL